MEHRAPAAPSHAQPQYINFQFVPPNLRVLAVNFVALAWNVYMSWSSHKKVLEAPVPAPPAALAGTSPKGSPKGKN